MRKAVVVSKARHSYEARVGSLYWAGDECTTPVWAPRSPA